MAQIIYTHVSKCKNNKIKIINLHVDLHKRMKKKEKRKSCVQFICPFLHWAIDSLGV
jgi:hypothetical protein